MSVNGILGIDNRNPWNVKNVKGNEWRGSIATDAKGHAIFQHEIYSARAACRVIERYQVRDRCFTLNDIFKRYAPASDGNDPLKYAAFVAKRMEIRPDAQCVLFPGEWKTTDDDAIHVMLSAMAEYENFSGYRPGWEIIASGIALYKRGTK